ncbi:MAG TPA: DUF763 domain-containing protein [Longimicrobiales bacterium]|nr:DUF763 domain-containing protein [Longimicrobiales bacterium]
MPRRTGTADLPLHTGRAPAWLFDRMKQLAPAIVEVIVADRGPAAVLERLSDPHWFQAFGCVLGFDWHSSGVTTTVCGALKEGLAGREADTGIHVAGGKGKTSRKTPEELLGIGGRTGLDGNRLAYTSRMAAKVDSSAVQDGFDLYHHSFFVAQSGEWAVVQQGMRNRDGSARRYHWLGSRVDDLVNEPHAGVASDVAAQGVLNLVASESAATRTAATRFAGEDPARTAKEIARAITLELPRRHWVDIERDINPRHLKSVMLSTYQAAPADFEGLLAIKGVGGATLRALSLISELLYGAPASTRDPARYSFAHGGKDGFPFPVHRETYDHSIEFLSDALRRARIGSSERLHALRRLHSVAEDRNGNGQHREQPPGSS